jgi:prenyltransferase beta subunit
MLQVARLAPKLLGDSVELVRNFFLARQNTDGGFKDRDGKSDLYYTVFGIDGLAALQAEIPAAKIESFLREFGTGEKLDFIHLCCLARCWSALSEGRATRVPDFEIDLREKVLKRMETFRSRDGGYNIFPNSETGTVYGAFLAVAACTDLHAPILDPLRIVQSLKFLETNDGAWSNDRMLKIGSTNATAAAVTLLRNLGMPIDAAVGDWILQQAHPEGGFRAAPDSPIPDLLSTATALHALAGMERSFGGVKEKCLDFIDSLWTNEGGFHGHWADDHLDCEYTYYGLLALGHLSL